MNSIKCKTWLKIHNLSLLNMNVVEINIGVGILKNSISFVDFTNILIHNITNSNVCCQIFQKSLILIESHVIICNNI